ncbi:docking protein 2 isoform X2 [Ascaphus truei]|uniref:docking protein 2 isoform X2 n=1 Tax=Ascaphus truei TaxID=8439 RepID=UPI003F594C1C
MTVSVSQRKQATSEGGTDRDCKKERGCKRQYKRERLQERVCKRETDRNKEIARKIETTRKRNKLQERDCESEKNCKKEGQTARRRERLQKWRRVWGVLYGGSPPGLARLELYEGSQPTERSRKLECWRLVQLSDCVSVSERSGESSPRDTRTFSIETAERVYLLASETSEHLAWERLSLERQCSHTLQSGDLHLQDNSLYSTSRETGGQFEVRVRQTEASSRCGLSGTYTLTAESVGLTLRERQGGSVLYSWPYPFLRRFGRDKTMFSFEAGRRCTSGEGNFEFETPQGGHIFQSIESAISTRRDSPMPSGQEPAAPTKEFNFLPLPRLPQQPASSSSRGSSHPLPCPLGSGRGKLPPPESDYAVPFDKVARSLLASGFGTLLQQPPPQQVKGGKARRAEHIYDEPVLPPPVYDEPEVVRIDAWRTQGSDAHNAGYEYPYQPGLDDYAVPRGGDTRSGWGHEEEEKEEEWGGEGATEREYDNITLRGAGQES